MPRSSALRAAGPSAARRHGGSTTFFLIGLAILATVLGGMVWLIARAGGDGDMEKPLTASVVRDSYEHIVLEQGEVESSNNIEIRCEVRSRTANSGPSTSIIDVIAEGKVVQEGDWLVTFDSSALEQELSSQRITVNTSEAIMIQAKALYDTAVIARDEYLKGTYNEQRKAIENEIFVAEENLKKAQLSYDSIKRLVSRGLLNILQLEGERFRVDAARNELDLARQKLTVLHDYTKPKMLTQLESDIQAAEVKYRNEQDSHKEELKKLEEILDQIGKCKVYAPQAGQVVYANVRSSRSGSEFIVEPGAAVRERQVIIKLPDPRQMQVKATINESRVNLIRDGMPVTIRIDAFGDDTLQGRVTKVNKYAEPGNWWSSTAKEYATLIDIINPPPALRVGLTAEVQIHVERRGDALQIPVQAVLERGGKTFCLIEKDGAYQTRAITISSTNDKTVAIDEESSESLDVGEAVVMNPRKHVDLFDQSRFPAETKSSPVPLDEETAVESQPAEAGVNAAASAGSAAETKRSPEQVLTRWDQDQNGKLSSAELQAAPQQLQSRLATADANGDGDIDADELKTTMAQQPAPAATPAGTSAGDGGGAQ